MIYITGDTHGEFSRFSSSRFTQGRELTKNDYLIILGDYGGFWNNKQSDAEKYWQEWIGRKPWTTLFLDGNHENFSILDSFPTEKRFGGIVGVTHKTFPIYHLKRGEVYTIDNKKIFVFGGGYSIDILRRTPNISWWEREMPNYKEYQNGLDNLKIHDNKVDYIMTHTCSNVDFEKIKIKYNMIEKISEPELPLRNYFDEIRKNVSYEKWYCGHFHVEDNTNDKINFLYESIVKI
jgi:DNA repair exonuclease SbcCD nuclease subunit